jgi:uncharacterized protein
MEDKVLELYLQLSKEGLSPQQEKIMKLELESAREHKINYPLNLFTTSNLFQIYHRNDPQILNGYIPSRPDPLTALYTFDELLEKDKKRVEDGFQRKIKLGKIGRPGKGGKIVIVPTTTEEKFIHNDNYVDDEGESNPTGGSGKGDEGEVIGENPMHSSGSGQGNKPGGDEEGDHGIETDPIELGKILTEKFNLPNLEDKGKKTVFKEYIYELTDRNEGSGQHLDEEETLERVVITNMILGRVDKNKPIDTSKLIISPDDEVYRVLSRERKYQSQAIVFFVRDYSGSMEGNPTKVIVTKDLMINSWLMYQYQGLVIPRFILHDTKAKEVPDFNVYYNSTTGGGTRVAPAFQYINEIIEKENLARDYNIYVFYGTDGDDWNGDGKETIPEIRKMLSYVNRLGITVVQSDWGYSEKGKSAVETYINKSGLLEDKKHFRMDSIGRKEMDEDRIIKSIIYQTTP